LINLPFFVEAPVLTIIVPCYNYAHLLPQTLDNLRRQTFKNWECIVVDDGSTDHTASVAQGFVELDARFSYVFQKNAGLSAARNTGVRHAKGQFIQLLDADDLLEAEKAAVQVKILLDNADFDLVYSEVRYFKSSEPNTLLYALDGSNMPWMPCIDSGNPHLLHTQFQMNIMAVNCALFRKSVFDRVGYFNEALKSVEDWEFWCRCLLQGCILKFDKSPHTFARVRIHEGSMSTNTLRMIEASIMARVNLRSVIKSSDLGEQVNELIAINERELLYLHRNRYQILRTKLPALKRLKLLLKTQPGLKDWKHVVKEVVLKPME
jgi:glycosyltransferase involved in cell wall biosynthesis